VCTSRLEDSVVATNGASKKPTNGAAKQPTNGTSTKPATSATARGGKGGKPNILIIWGDDIGWFNISAHNQGIMGYRTPNIDRVAKEGIGQSPWS